ncbi:filamentous hemagglutinin N-terminal domain-containing protein [Lusitaniella coriacea]|uniref:two-partner secretion domain-containing protein n=1 Tax=Lusitaniella coriacea TaxID=1983105 RepID=UPI003CF859D0
MKFRFFLPPTGISIESSSRKQRGWIQCKHGHFRSYFLKILEIAGYLLLASGFSGQSVEAQLIPDNTLGAESSIVTPLDALRRVDGGAVRGINLFHSFLEFNVSNGGSVYFANPTGIENILTRVTGSNSSNILGTLGVLGNANLFLINPNGIYFGANSRLDVSGSFLATTADGIQLGDSGYFSATDIPGSQLLSVQPGALFTNALRNWTAQINNQGNLSVGAGQTLTLFADETINSGSLTAPGGKVRVLGDRVTLLFPGKIDVSSPFGGGTALIGGDYQGQGTIPTARETFVGSGVTINADDLNAGDGGKVIVWSDESTEFLGSISARGGELGGNGGFVEVSGLKTLNFQGQVDTLAPNGNPGMLLLDPTNITVINGAGTFTDLTQVDNTADPDIGANTIDVTLINNAATNVTLQATNDINFNAVITMTTPGVGLAAQAGSDIAVNQSISTTGGAVTLDAGQNIALNNGAEINTFPTVGGTGGDVTLNAGSSVTLNANSRINTGFPDLNAPIDGQAGNISIIGRDRVSLTNSEVTARSFNDTVDPDNFTTVEIAASQGSVFFDNSTTSATNLGAGFAGDVNISGRDTISIVNGSGVFSNGRLGRIFIGSTPAFPNSISPNRVEIASGSRLIAANGSSGAPAGNSITAGDIIINALGEISLSQSTVSTLTERRGDAGRIVFESEAGDILLNNSFISSEVTDVGVGDAGIVGFFANSLAARRSNIAAGTSGQGDAGGILVQVSDAVFLSDETTLRSNVEQGGMGDGGLIAIEGRSLTMTGGAQIQSAVFRAENGNPGGRGNGGGILVETTDSVNLIGFSRNPFLRTGLFASTEQGAEGSGGNIIVETNNLLVLDGAIINAQTQNANNAGNIFLNLDGILFVEDFGLITTSGLSTGDPGNIFITARGLLLDRGGRIEAISNSGRNADIFLVLDVGALLFRDSAITTEARNDGSGGNIEIFAGVAVLANFINNGDIVANAFAGSGGSVAVRTLLFRSFNPTGRTSDSDATASSEFGVQGTRSIEEQFDKLPEIPADLLNVETLNQDICALRDGKIAGGSSFVIPGSGGLPQNPTQTLTPVTGTVEWANRGSGATGQTTSQEGIVSPVVLRERASEESNERGSPKEIRQAQGWKVNSDGTVMLVANIPLANASPSILTDSVCSSELVEEERET